MITIITKGKDRRRIFRFVCKDCGCVYKATEDECTPIFTYTNVGGMELKSPMLFCNCNNKSFETIKMCGMELKCPMPFCDYTNRAFEPINKED